MADRRVFILWNNLLFHESVRLLLNHPGIKCVGESDNYTTASDEILLPEPDTILVEEVDGFIPAEVMKILESSQWNVRVIGLNLWDNQMRTYHRVQQTVGKAADLLHQILGDQ